MSEKQSGRTIDRSPEAERARYNWLTTGEAAIRIGGPEHPVSTSHVLKLIEAKQLRARNVAMPTSKRKDYRVDPASVEEFLDRVTSDVEAA